MWYKIGPADAISCGLCTIVDHKSLQSSSLTYLWSQASSRHAGTDCLPLRRLARDDGLRWAGQRRHQWLVTPRIRHVTRQKHAPLKPCNSRMTMQNLVMLWLKTLVTVNVDRYCFEQRDYLKRKPIVSVHYSMTVLHNASRFRDSLKSHGGDQ